MPQFSSYQRWLGGQTEKENIQGESLVVVSDDHTISPIIIAEKPSDFGV